MKYIFLCLMLFLAACSQTQPIEQVPIIETRTIEVRRPAPIVPPVDQLRLRTVRWFVITPENIEEKFAEITNGERVFFALTAEGYENLALNLSDIRALIAQQQRIIAIYKSQF